ncbi:MAG: hypothetical protein LBS55_06595 [Prevotellaceae bacterium]|jgi:hypothetical protein|nr:hypothetical protein [Prevotellaceae bacterium]
MDEKKSIELKAKEMAKIFNLADIPELPCEKMMCHLKGLGLSPYSQMLSRNERVKFFNEREGRKERCKRGSSKVIYLSKKKEPIHYSAFVEFLKDARKESKERLERWMRRHADSNVKQSDVKQSDAKTRVLHPLTVEICIAFLKENGYTGKIEKVVKTELEI